MEKKTEFGDNDRKYVLYTKCINSNDFMLFHERANGKKSNLCARRVCVCVHGSEKHRRKMLLLGEFYLTQNMLSSGSELATNEKRIHISIGVRVHQMNPLLLSPIRCHTVQFINFEIPIRSTIKPINEINVRQYCSAHTGYIHRIVYGEYGRDTDMELEGSKNERESELWNAIRSILTLNRRTCDIRTFHMPSEYFGMGQH